ncbi:MAG TPA: substrate-binding domain-containing protein [Actinomycetota bacterium]|nr:substrate-binding domain-containing protein [Actinomycetota bacterium]
MSAPEGVRPAGFQAPPFDAVLDLCGDPVTAHLRALLGGNQYMVLPDLFSSFLGSDPGAGPIFYETLPSGVLTEQLRLGGLHMGSLELRFTPDLIAAGPDALARLHREGLVESPAGYAGNVLALLVASGDPCDVGGMDDLGRAGLRVALPNPETEGIGGLTLQALEAAGGSELRDRVFVHKRGIGETVLTSIHQRQAPAWLREGSIDVAVVWDTEARHLVGAGVPVERVEIEALVNQRGHYAAAVVSRAPHHAAAGSLLRHLSGPDGASTYQRYGFSTGT